MTREELIRNLKYTMEKHENDTVDTFGTNISVMCKDILDYLEQEPKTGHWIKKDFGYQCSECGLCTNYRAAAIMYRYCLNCGAKMEEE